MDQIMTTTTSRCLALVIAILSFGLPVVVQAQRKPDATRILNNMFRAYSGFASYQDEGILVVTSEDATGGRIEKMPFKTFFKRPNLFRFEWTDYAITKLGRTKMIWFNGKEAFMYWEPDEYEQKESLRLAVAGATGVSHGVVKTVSDLLMPDELGGSRLKQLSKVSFLVAMKAIPRRSPIVSSNAWVKMWLTACVVIASKQSRAAIHTNCGSEKLTFSYASVGKRHR